MYVGDPQVKDGYVPKPGEIEWVQQQMKFHGTYIATHEDDGWYFYRGGKKCRLW